MTPTNAEMAEFKAVAAELGLSPDDRMRALRALGWLPPVRYGGGGSAFGVRDGYAGPGVVSVRPSALDRTAPPPSPTFAEQNAAVRAAVEGGEGYRVPVPTVRSSAQDRSVPPPPDFNAAVRAMVAARDAKRKPAETPSPSAPGIRSGSTPDRVPSPTFADHNARIRSNHTRR